MLRVLRVGNLALVDELEIRPAEGLTMITGETGAGKSLIAGALSLLTGGRTDRGLVRQGTDTAYVEGVFDLAERPADRDALAGMGVRVGADGVVVLRRELRVEGRGRVLINGLVSSLALLEQIGARLLAIQSQDQQRVLGDPAFAGRYLDEALGLQPQLASMRECLAQFTRLSGELASRRQEAEEARRQLEFWEYQHRELTEADLDPEEPELLAEKLALGRNARALVEAAETCRLCLTEGESNARAHLGSAETVLTPLAADSPRLESVLGMIRDAAANTSEAAADLERFLDRLDLDPARLEETESRDASYRELTRKYARDVEGLLELQEELADRIERQKSAAGDLDALAGAVDQARAAAGRQAAELSRLRRKGARKVAARAESAIRPLALPDLELEFEIRPDAQPDGWVELDAVRCGVTDRGADRIELLARTNRGEAAGPVGKIASGGERSRIFLGLSVTAAAEGDRPLLLFDEIDSGLGMDNAVPVAEKMAALANEQQVLCITHLATVACRGAGHWRVWKRERDGRTVLRVEELAGESRVRETARLLGGDAVADDLSETQLEYARRLLAGGERASTAAE